MSVVVQVPVADVVPSPWQPRRNITAESVRELADSIAKAGQLQPVVTRELPDGRHELLAGGRRHRAHQVLEAETIDAHVLDVDDDQAREIVLIENAQREDVPPLEEAELLARLVETSSPADVAERIGKSPSYIHGRLRLLDLIEALQERLRAGEVTLTLALRIARLDPAAQESAAKAVEKSLEARTTGWGEAEAAPPPIGWKDVARVVSSLMLPLADAPFPTTSKLAKAPACTKCPKRTGAQTALFADGLEEADRCTDQSCWGRKLDAHWKKLEKKHRAAGGEVVQPDATFEPSFGGERPVFNVYGDDVHLDYSAPFVDLDADTYHEGKTRKWRDLLGELDPSTVTLARVGNRILHLAPREEASKAAQADHGVEEAEETPGQREARLAREAKWEEERQRRELESRIRPHLIAKCRERIDAGGELDPRAVLAAVLPWVEDAAFVEEEEAERLKALPVEWRIVELLFADQESWKCGGIAELRPLAEALGIDVEALEAETESQESS